MLLRDHESAVTATCELTGSPLAVIRAIGWALIAWLSAFVAPENVDGLLAKSATERSEGPESATPSSDAHALAGAFGLWTTEIVALMSGDFERSRNLSHELARTDTALGHLRRLATRAATGVYRGESDDAMLMFAAFAHHHGDGDAACEFLLVAGRGRQPGTIAYGRHLAKQLGIFDEYMSQPVDLDDPGANRSRNALHAELSRRGWD